jgi:hypothetical protein
MQEPDEEGVASHLGPESCAGRREASGEALTGEAQARLLSCDIMEPRGAHAVIDAEGHIGRGAQRKSLPDPAQSETRCMRGRSSPELGRSR